MTLRHPEAPWGRPLALAAAAALLSGCLSPHEPSARERRQSFRDERRSWTGDSARAVLETFLVIAASGASTPPSVDAATGALSVPPAPEGTYTQGLSVGVDADGYLLTAGHLLRARSWVVGWMDGRLQVKPARIVHRSGPSGGADIALIHVDGRLDYCGRLGPAPSRGDPVFAVVCIRSAGGIGGSLDLAGGVVRGGGGRPGRPADPVVTSDVPLWHGDSGGPLLSADGDVVAINSAIELTGIGVTDALGGFRRVSYVPDASLVLGAIAADKSGR